MEFHNPIFLVLLLLVPVIYHLAARLGSSVVFSSLEDLDSGPVTLRVRLSGLPPILIAIVAALLIVAMARPRTGDATTIIKREGLAIVMAVDRSGSMSAMDFSQAGRAVSRLDAVKKVFHDFVAGGGSQKGRPDDLIGLVAFGTYADGPCPLTLDHPNLLAILGDLKVATERGEQATAIGEGLGLAIERLAKVPEGASKVVILLTDGVNNAGQIDPVAATKLAVDNHVRVYTIGVGRTGYAPMPVMARDGRIHLQRAYVETDPATLKTIAEQTGGRFFKAENTRALAQVYDEINSLEKTKIVETRYLRYREHFVVLVAIALALLIAATMAAATFLRRLP